MHGAGNTRWCCGFKKMIDNMDPYIPNTEKLKGRRDPYGNSASHLENCRFRQETLHITREAGQPLKSTPAWKWMKCQPAASTEVVPPADRLHERYHSKLLLPSLHSQGLNLPCLSFKKLSPPGRVSLYITLVFSLGWGQALWGDGTSAHRVLRKQGHTGGLWGTSTWQQARMPCGLSEDLPHED